MIKWFKKYFDFWHKGHTIAFIATLGLLFVVIGLGMAFK